MCGIVSICSSLVFHVTRHLDLGFPVAVFVISDRHPQEPRRKLECSFGVDLVFFVVFFLQYVLAGIHGVVVSSRSSDDVVWVVVDFVDLPCLSSL